MKNNLYESPDMEIVKLTVDDIFTASTGGLNVENDDETADETVGWGSFF